MSNVRERSTLQDSLTAVEPAPAEDVVVEEEVVEEAPAPRERTRRWVGGCGGGYVYD